MLRNAEVATIPSPDGTLDKPGKDQIPRAIGYTCLLEGDNVSLVESLAVLNYRLGDCGDTWVWKSESRESILAKLQN